MIRLARDDASTTRSPFAIGVDVIEIERVAHVLRRHGGRFLERVYTSRELDYCGTRTASLATRFAAKEAIAKALGTGIGAVHWTDIEILSDSRGKPNVRLRGHAAWRAKQLGIGHLEVSLSHSRTVAVAVVVTSRTQGADPE